MAWEGPYIPPKDPQPGHTDSDIKPTTVAKYLT